MSTTDPLAPLASRALAWLASERDRGYADATHVMRFPHRLGFTGAEIQRGDVFIRALVADAVCDARDARLVDDGERLDAECDYLMSRHGSGGWRYFPDLPELPGDADTLGAVCQVLARCSRAADLRRAEVAINQVLARVDPLTGAFGTWVLPSVPHTPQDCRSALFVEATWGDTRDPEVVASLLYALFLIDRTRFAGPIDKGARWLAGQQRDDGSLPSTWYNGAYYGTFVAMRLFAALQMVEPVRRGVAFLLASCGRHGGWPEPVFDQLATGLALCTLAYCWSALADDDAQAEARIADSRDSGLATLSASIAIEGFTTSTFIVMDVGRVEGVKTRRRTYGSRTVAALYALKACALWTTATDPT